MSMTLSELEQVFEKAGLEYKREDESEGKPARIVTGIPTKTYSDKDGDKVVIIFFSLDEPTRSSAKVSIKKLSQRLKDNVGSEENISEKDWQEVFDNLASDSEERKYEAIQIEIRYLYKWPDIEEFHKKISALNNVNFQVKFSKFVWDKTDGEVMYSHNISLDDEKQKIEPKTVIRLLTAIRAGVDRLADTLAESPGGRTSPNGRTNELRSSRVQVDESVDSQFSSPSSELSNEGLI